jgi:hypothetical protein
MVVRAEGGSDEEVGERKSSATPRASSRGPGKQGTTAPGRPLAPKRPRVTPAAELNAAAEVGRQLWYRRVPISGGTSRTQRCLAVDGLRATETLRGQMETELVSFQSSR